MHVSSEYFGTKVSLFVQCIKKQLITLQNFHIQYCFSQFLWFCSLKCWFKGQIISRIHLILPNAYKLMCFDKTTNGNRDVKILECDYLLLQWCVKFTLEPYEIYYFLFITSKVEMGEYITNVKTFGNLTWKCLLWILKKYIKLQD